jgi:hypothetical protein
MPKPESGGFHPHSRLEAEVEHLYRVLHRYGVLTRQRLLEECGVERWGDATFRAVLRQAVADGRVRPLGDELFECVEPAVEAGEPRPRRLRRRRAGESPA